MQTCDGKTLAVAIAMAWCTQVVTHPSERFVLDLVPANSNRRVLDLVPANSNRRVVEFYWAIVSIEENLVWGYEAMSFDLPSLL